MDGNETTKRILKMLALQQVQCSIVGLSAFTSNLCKQKSLKLGMVDYINKPLKYQELKRIMLLYFLPFLGE